MANYKSQYTGEQIDEAIGKASLGSCIGYWKLKPTLSIPEEPLYTSLDSMMANAKPVDMVFIQYKEKPYIYNVKSLFIGNVDLSAMGGNYAMLVGKAVLGLTDEGESFILYLESYGGNDDTFLIKTDINDLTIREWIFDNCDNVTTYPKTVLYNHCVFFKGSNKSIYIITKQEDAFTVDTLKDIYYKTLSAYYVNSSVNSNADDREYVSVYKILRTSNSITFTSIEGSYTFNYTDFDSDIVSIV